MLPRVDVNGPVWRDEGVAGGAEEQEATVKSELGHLSGFKPILEEDWYLGSSADPSPPESALLQPVDSSPSCSPSSVAFNLDPSQHFLSHKAAISSLLNVVCSNPFDSPADFDLGCDNPVFLGGAQVPDSTVLLNRGVGDGHAGILGFPGLCSCAPVGAQDLRLPLPESGGAASFGFAFDGYPFFNRPKVLQPLEIVPPVGAQPTLFQKRAAALRQSSGLGGAATIASGSYGALMAECSAEQARRGKGGAAEDMGNANIDFSGFNYDSQEGAAEDATNTSNANSTVTACGGGGERKGKKKGMPAKNLMAERRRRKKLNDRLYMLRSVVPKISKMDRASILGDAVEYLKKLLQRINDLHNELESTPCASPLTSSITASCHPLTPTPCTLPWRVKEELCPSPLPSPCGQLPTVDVREKEGRAVNIHMFCARRPGLLLSTMRALDALGLDIQQAVISCFNGFALDVFRAEQCKDGPGVRAEDIKALLLHTAGCLGAM